MSHDTHTTSDTNADLLGLPELRARRHYLDLAQDWVDPFPAPVLELHGGFCVVREDLLEVGSKARFGDLLVQRLPRSKPIVYVAPRFGFAAISLAFLARRHRRKLVLFMPSSARVSEHQAVAIEMGAEARFARIAAMPNLNKIARDWADANGGSFVPLGLRHPFVTAAIVKVADGIITRFMDEDQAPESNRLVYNPVEVWSAMSTGVLSRGLQIAWPASRFRAVAVARNIHDGERGRALIHTCPQEFAQNATCPPPFPSASNYDAKVWEFMVHTGLKGALFWNVAGNIKPTSSSAYDVDSFREWGDDRDYK